MGIFNNRFDITPWDFKWPFRFEKEPSIIDKVEMLFTDAEEEERKKGYSRAAEEYGKVFRSIESEYKQAKELIESQKNMYDMQSDALIEKLEALEKQKRRLENQVEQKTKAVSEKYDIPVSQVKSGLNSSNGFIASEPWGSPGSILLDIVLDIAYNHKAKKLREAERRGYSEAKKLYEEKIGKLKKELEELKRKGSAEIQEMSNMIIEILDAIADEQMKIAELEILL